MERHLDQHLEAIRQNLLRMGIAVEEMLRDVMRALLERDTGLSAEVVKRDRAVDDMEKKIDVDCHAVMALQQPTAGDLRFLIAVSKITNDLERVGDCAKNIGEHAELLHREPQVKPYIDLPKMGELALSMVHDALDAFLTRDADKALEVCRSDNEIDKLYEQIYRELLTYMIEDPTKVSAGIRILLIAHDLERAADHATNVAEQVIYYLEGRDIRHTPEGTGAKAPG